MRRVTFIHTYNSIISVENLLEAWKEFLKGKVKKRDVQIFRYNLSDNIQALHDDLKNKTYRHSEYEAFNISDPKPRHIHKALVRDRLLHRALYRKLYPFFDRTFIADSFSCRKNKGTHKALKRFRYFSNKVSKNNTRTVWVLKCDIRKFFASIDQSVLIEIIKEYISDKDIVELVSNIIDSFSTEPDKGLPLGNLTSQLLVNIYMNKFDQFVKHTLKARYYIRYADDFVFLSHDKKWLEDTILPQIANFLEKEIYLSLHPKKTYIKTLASGVDFLGWVHFTDHSVVRTVTKRRMMKTIKQKEAKEEVVQSYLGLLSHGNAYKLINKVHVLVEEIVKRRAG